MKQHARLAGPTALIVALLLAVPTRGEAWRGGGGRGGSWHARAPGVIVHRHPGPVFGHRPRAFVDGFFFFDPFFFPYYVPYPVYAYPPPPEDWGEPPPDAEQTEPPGSSAEAEQQAAEASSASYGLVQLHGVPDGAAVELDGRFWLEAQQLDDRWLALPRGAHTLTVRVQGHDPVERRIDVVAGKTLVVRVGPFRERHT